MRKLLLTAMIFSVLSVTCAQAVSINDISVDFGTQSVKITGNGNPNEDVVIQIINPGQAMPAPEDGFVDGVFNHFGNTATDEDGNFEYAFIMSGVTTTDENKYLARVSADSGLNEKKFDFTSIDDIDNKLELINGAADKETMNENIGQTIKLLSFSPIEPYEKMTDSDKLKIAEKMMSVKPFSNIDVMLDTYNKFILIQALNNEADAAEFKNLLAKYASELFDDIYSKELDESGKSKSIDILKSNIKSVNDYDDLGLNFKIANLLACGQTATKSNIVNAIVEYKDIFTVIDKSMSSYIKSFMESSDDTKASVAGKIIDKSPSEISQVSAVIKEYFTPTQKPTEDTDSKSGSKSGSISGKKTYTVELPNVAVPNPREEIKKDIFGDITKNHWAYEAVAYLHDKGIVNGKGDNKFGTDDLVTRAEMIKMLMAAFNVELKTGSEEFEDVSESDWYYKYVSTAAAINVAKGVGNGCFAPNMNVTREDMAVFLDRVIKYSGKQLKESADTAQFEDDSQISDYAKTAVYAMKKVGIINGKADGRFDPKAYATRAEMAKMLYVALQSL